MPQITVKWIIEGEKTVEAASVEAAEEAIHQELVSVLTNPEHWPEALGALSVQGSGRVVPRTE